MSALGQKQTWHCPIANVTGCRKEIDQGERNNAQNINELLSQCPLWVKSRRRVMMSRACPLYPRKRRSIDYLGMPAWLLSNSMYRTFLDLSLGLHLDAECLRLV